MRAQLLQRFLLVAVTLAVAAGVWFLPRADSSGVSPPPASIELRSRPAPTASPEAAAPSRAVDDRGDDADDGGGVATHKRAERRTSRESVPDAGTRRADDDGGDQDDDGDDDGDGGDDDQDGDD